MNILKIAWSDFSSILKNRFIRVSIAAIIILPLLYSFLFLDAFWDPYNNLQKVHIAVVNLDKGGINDGKDINYGNEIIDRLKTNHKVGWTFTTKQDAYNGLVHKKYYAEFVIPENFTSTSLKLKDIKAEQLKIYYADNEKTNFIMSQLDKNVKLELKAEITKNLMDKGAGEIFDKLADAKPGIKEVVNGGKNLKEGVESLNKGTPEMKTGVDKLKNGATDIANGLNTVSMVLDNKPLASKNKTITVNKDNDLYSMMKPGNVKKLKTVMKDASKLQNTDTSMLSIVPKLLTPENIKLLNKMGYDVKEADVATLLKDPNLKSLSGALTPSTIKGVGNLLNDANQLSNINMLKLLPMVSLLNNSNQLSNLMGQAQMLGNMDMSVLIPFGSLLGQSSQLNGLMTQAMTLSQMDLSKLDSVKQLLTPENGAELSSLLKNASGLGSIDTKAMGTFLTEQVAEIDKFNTDTEVLRNSDTLKMLSQLIDAQYPVNGAPAEQKANEQLKGLVNGYYNAVLQTNTNMQATKAELEAMGKTLADLYEVQGQLLKDSKLISGTGAALTPENIAAISDMLGKLQTAQNSMKTPSAIATFKSIQTALAPDNIKALSDMLQKLQAAQNSMKTPEAIAAINTVQSALAPDNISYIEGVMNQLTAMKTDLDKNKTNLLLAQGLMKKFDDPKTMTSINKIKTLSGDLDKATPFINTLSSEMTSENMAKLSDAPKLVNQLTSMQKELKDNNEVLLLAQRALNDDNVELANNLINSIPDLTNKVNMIADGTTSLYNSIDKLMNNKESIKKFVSEPIVIDEKNYFPVKNYGSGFAPYFIPLSLWVGALIMFFVVSDKVDEDIKASSGSLVIGKFLSFAFIGMMQAIIVSIAILSLGLKPDNVIIYFAFNIFMSIVFIAIIQCLVFLMGMVGRMIALVMLILQLTSCAGTFPLELVPTFFKVINPFLPFTYCVSALREIIAGINYSVLSKDCLVLGGIMILFLTISVLFKGHADKVKNVIIEKQNSIA